MRPFSAARAIPGFAASIDNSLVVGEQASGSTSSTRISGTGMIAQDGSNTSAGPRCFAPTMLRCASAMYVRPALGFLDTPGGFIGHPH
jgi:hypothetical protein